MVLGIEESWYMPVQNADRDAEHTGAVLNAWQDILPSLGPDRPDSGTGVGIAVTAQIWTDIFGNEPEDIGPARRLRLSYRGKTWAGQHGDNQAGDHAMSHEERSFPT